MEIRIADREDSSAILQIYQQYIDTAITFECTLPSEEDFAKRLESISENYPYLVCVEQGRIIGYAYAHRQMEREAYQWNAELSIYLDRGFHSRGIGKSMYCILMDILKLQGVKTVYGGVTLPNEKSEHLHLGLGFTILGTYHNTGYKCGKWHDVRWYEKQISPYNAEPLPFTSISNIQRGDIEKILLTSKHGVL